MITQGPIYDQYCIPLSQQDTLSRDWTIKILLILFLSSLYSSDVSYVILCQAVGSYPSFLFEEFFAYKRQGFLYYFMRLQEFLEPQIKVLFTLCQFFLSFSAASPLQFFHRVDDLNSIVVFCSFWSNFSSLILDSSH